MYTKEQAIRLLLEDRVLFIRTLLKVEDKWRNVVPLDPSPIQLDMLKSRTGRDVYVKPAQIGATTIFIADFLIDCLTLPGTVSIIISYDEFITSRLLRKAQAIYNNLKNDIPSIPQMEHKGTFEKTFKGMNSSFYINSARSAAFGRGETIHNLLIDEYAFWPQDATEKLWSSAIQRVPLTDRTKVVFLSTPNGEDNDFYEVYMAAKEGKSVKRSVYTAHFYPWYAHPEYALSPDNPFVLAGDDTDILSDLTPEELGLLRVFELNGIDEQSAHNKIRWRRYKRAEMLSANRSGETALLFEQEYPENDVDCFLSTGDSVYDSEMINSLAKQCYPAPTNLNFANIWYSPQDGHKYLLAIDPGEGKISESVATVWEFTEEDFVHCATLSGLYEQQDMAGKCIDLAIYYNHAVIANEDALDMNVHLKSYGNLYYRTDPETGRISRLIGWQTNKSTKPYMVSEVLRNFSKIRSHDIRLVGQFRNIRWAKDKCGKNRPVAIGADDYHDSCAIAIVCRTSLPIERGCVGAAGWSSAWGR